MGQLYRLAPSRSVPSGNPTRAFSCSFTYSDSPPSILWPMPRLLAQRCSMPVRHRSPVAARLREDGGHRISNLEALHGVAHLGHRAGDLVAQDNPLLDPAAQHALHHQHVVVAEAAGVHLDQHVIGVRRGHVPLFNGESRHVSGFFKDKGFHGCSPRLSAAVGRRPPA